MCGIFGSFNFNRQPVDQTIINDASSRIRHRGPDASGFHSDNLVLLGNRRLSILDLSERSDQPIYSDDENVIVVQNGEIYNFLELRSELEEFGHKFRTTGDTEVILRAYEHWGHEFVERLNGMFAIAIFNRSKETLYLYRDRLGVKPLYISRPNGDGRLWFASEIKSILANRRDYKVNLEAVAQYLALNYVPPPNTMFTGIEHLPPAHIAKITSDGSISFHKYWDLSAVKVEKDISLSEASTEFLGLLEDATRIRMRADAPFGAFLSGGLDSSSVVGFMSKDRQKSIRTYSVGFQGSEYDETYFARMASDRFGTNHKWIDFQANVYKDWPHYIWHCDQPHGDVSFMPMNSVSKLASQDVKMVLTGDGGDELFAGYEKYDAFFSNGIDTKLQDGWEDRYARESGLLNEHQMETLLTGDLHSCAVQTDPYELLSGEIKNSSLQDPINKVLLADTKMLLPGNNLVKSDRMAMANSLEIRSPLLDYRMAEFAFSIAGSFKLKPGETKWFFKKAVEDLLGLDLTYRRKQMFTVPIGDWMKTSLVGYVRKLLLDGRLGDRKLVSEIEVEKMLNDHIEGRQNNTRQLRALVSLEIWYRLFVDNDQEMLGDMNAGGHLS